MFDLEIDGQRAIVSLGLQGSPPPFAREDHLYPVIYDVGADARPIAFRISDNTVNDNTGEFKIEVVQLE
ncbi:MAG: hypothetical protein HY866_23080 [Chloroflexi bacterium]|nr:hypothetical protein [Chloroflexota bacterium]